MLNCASEQLDQTCSNSTEALAYLFEVFRRNSLCFKRKKISEIIESSDDFDNIVTDSLTKK